MENEEDVNGEARENWWKLVLLANVIRAQCGLEDRKEI